MEGSLFVVVCFRNISKRTDVSRRGFFARFAVVTGWNNNRVEILNKLQVFPSDGSVCTESIKVVKTLGACLWDTLTSIQLQGVLKYPIIPRCPRVWT